MTYGDLVCLAKSEAGRIGLLNFDCDASLAMPGIVTLYTTPLTMSERHDLYAAIRMRLPLGIQMDIRPSLAPINDRRAR